MNKKFLLQKIIINIILRYLYCYEVSIIKIINFGVNKC